MTLAPAEPSSEKRGRTWRFEFASEASFGFVYSDASLGYGLRDGRTRTRDSEL